MKCKILRLDCYINVRVWYFKNRTTRLLKLPVA